MLPLKLRALSDESDESDSETETPRITKELLEEKALKEYREALTLKQQKRFGDAEELLLNLVNSSLLSEAEGQVGFTGGRIEPSLLHLKYGCFINLGSINAEANNLEEALEYYVKAIELDSTDINIWYKIGKIALDIHNLDLAVQAFNNGFQCNESHWPTLDNLITALFSIGDYLSCLYMIWRAFELDADYVKGHVFKQYISTNHACFIETFKCIHAECTFGPDQPIPVEYEHLILDTAFALRTNACAEDQFLVRSWEKPAESNKRTAVRLNELSENSWEELGTKLMQLYEQIDQEEIGATYYTPVILVSDSSQDNVNVVQMKRKDEETRKKKQAEPSTEPTDLNIGTRQSLGKKRNTPSTLDQSHLCDKRRSSRQRGLNKKEDPSLCVALRSVIPEDLLPLHEVDMFKDSPDPIRWTEDTLELIGMFDDLEDMTLDSTGELSALFVQRLSEGERNTLLSGYFSSPDREGADVATFLSLHSNQNILNLFLAYLRSLCAKWNILWPASLKSLYCSIFNTISAHFSSGRFRVCVDKIEDEHTSASDNSADLLRTNTMVLVLFGELTLNACIEKGEFLRSAEDKELFPSLLFQELYDAESSLDLCSDSDLSLYLRLKHFTFLWPLYNSGTDLTSHIEHLDSLVAALEEVNYNERLVLMNNGYYQVISKEVYGRLRTVLEVTRDLQEVISIYTYHLQCDSECNKAVFSQLVSHLEYSLTHEETLTLVKLLKLNTLHSTSTQLPTALNEEVEGEGNTSGADEEEEGENIYDVISQYDYLLKLCYELNYNERCFKYSACFLNKLISRFKKLNTSINNSPSGHEAYVKRRSACTNRITDIISRLLYCINKADSSLFQVLTQDQYKQLILNLCQLICYQIEFMQDSANTISPELTSVPFDTIQHWLVLYYIVKHEESKPSLNTSTDSATVESSPEKTQDDLYFRTAPYSTRLLFIAHEYLGKRAWCCHENGVLLFKIIDVVTEDYIKYNTLANLENAHFHEFLQHIDQVFYCLYGHPASKQCVRNYIKQKYYLQSHNALGVAFTYERAKQIYFFYKTNKVAEYDTLSKNFSISFDVETLFRNIIREIPDKEKPDKYIDQVYDGIKKSSSFSQIFSGVERHLCKELRDIYYYIGDYHFKNKVFNKAIQYYLLDICVNHYRVDAWAAMTLSQQKDIETILNSGDTIDASEMVTSSCLWTMNSFKITSSLKCKPPILTIFIEYGTFAYTIAAFCSRRIKCESVVGDMSLEQFTALEKLKTELLSTCKENFIKATQVLEKHFKYNQVENDEKWLHLYMLGKYYEKTDSADPKSCLNNYYQAFETLRIQNGALYPLKVNYSEPQTGAVESLELFYRIHATILKFIDRSGDHVLDHESVAFYLEMVRRLSVSRFMFTDNDPLEALGANVTIVEEDNEQDVEIICTVQEVMNKVLMMTQMASEQDLDEEDTSSESEASSSEDSESESDSSSESESESSEETSSSEEEKDDGVKRNRKKTDEARDKANIRKVQNKVEKIGNEKKKIIEKEKSKTKVENVLENDKTESKTNLHTPADNASTTLGGDHTKAGNGMKRKQASSVGEDEVNNGDKKMKIEDENESESRKRKAVELLEKEEQDEKRVKTENDDGEKCDTKLEQGGAGGIGDNRVEVVETPNSVEENVQGLNENDNLEREVKKLEVSETNEAMIDDESVKSNTNMIEGVRNNAEAVKCETVEVKLETNKIDGTIKDTDKLATSNIADDCAKSCDLSDKSSANDKEQNSKNLTETLNKSKSESSTTENVPKTRENMMTPKEDEKPTKVEVPSNSQESKRSFSMAPKKMKIMDSINFLDCINSSCDNIFENLNKIVSTCDSAVQESESRSGDANDSETNAVESDSASGNAMSDNGSKQNTPSTDTKHAQTQIQDTKAEDKSAEKTVKTDQDNSNGMDKEIIKDTTTTRDEEIEVIQVSKPDKKIAEIVIEDSMEDIEILDPESGMLVTTKQKKIKENETAVDNSEKKIDEDTQHSKLNKDNASKDNDSKRSVDTQANTSMSGVRSQENTTREQDDAKMDIDENKTNTGMKSEKVTTQVKESNRTKPVKDSSKNVKNPKGDTDKNKMEIDNSSSEEEDSESSDSETSGSSEEEKVKSSKKKQAPKLKTSFKKRLPRNEQTQKKKRELRKWKRNKKEIISYCTTALEECHRRFPEHFKSLYRLAYHYYHSTSDRDVDKARSILLDGLFRQRKQKDFFKGLWRPPVADLDRPGSFAYHMSRSIHLVIDLLSETKDGKTLMDIAVALKDEPEAEKKYLRDNEREQFCQDALTVCEKILKDNLEDIRRNAIHEKSDMKKIFFDAKYIHSTYSQSKAWGSKDSVFSKLYGEIRMLLQKTLKITAQESSLVEESQPKKSKASASSGAFTGDKGVVTEKAFEKTDRELQAKKESYNVSSMSQMTNPVPQPVPLPRIQPPVSLAGDMFGSHFLASCYQRPTVPQPRILHPQPPVKSATPPQEMSLQQKLAAKQNPTGKLKNIGPNQTQPLKNIGPTQTHPLPGKNIGSTQAQQSQQSGYVATSSDSTSGKVYKPGKLTAEPGIIQSNQLQKPTSSSVPPPKIITINPTKYLNKTKQKLQQEGAKSNPKTDGLKPTSTPNVNIRPLQKPAHLTESGNLPTSFKLPKSVSLTRVNANSPPPRPESSKPKQASITKVMEPKRSESPKLKKVPTKVSTDPKPSTSSPQIIDLTTSNLPKAISITKVSVEGSKPSVQGQADQGRKNVTEQGKLQPKSVKIKKLQKAEANSQPRPGNGAAIKSNLVPSTSITSPVGVSLINKVKKSQGQKFKTKKTPSATTSALKNFRKPNSKEVKDKEEIIMIELD
uniref:Calcineurin-binding protein cabin-1 n=2 Tax=Cacopsylla melanoneura TaxID=428564 RepID=A0A8D8PYN5_9HEMI